MGSNYSPPDLHSSSGASAAAELHEAFDLYDEDKDGLISSSELHHVLNRLGMKCSMEECGRMIQGVDSDGDGCVSFAEFQKMMASNGDGTAIATAPAEK
ncbi:Probable calcium-binding protein CML27 [Linum perenne]